MIKVCSVCKKKLGKVYWEIMRPYGVWALFCDDCKPKEETTNKNADSSEEKSFKR